MISADPFASDKPLVRALRALTRARSVGQVGTIIRQHARRLLNADGATFVVREGDICYYADEDAIAPLWKGQRLHSSVCASFIKSLAIVPVRDDDPVAAIGVYWSVAHRATRDEMDTLRMLADGAPLPSTVSNSPRPSG